MKDLVKEYTKDNKILRMYYDTCPENPRDWANLGTMVCFHRRYNLGDPHEYREPDDFLFDLLEQTVGDTDKAERFVKKISDSIDRESYRSYAAYKKAVDDEIIDIIRKKFIILPLYLYDHSGITISTRPFACPWDSGQVGWIFCAKEKFLKETGYSRKELFSTDRHRKPSVGEHVKIAGRDFGKVISIKGDKITIDFDYNKIPSYKKPENIVACNLSDITEVLANRAEEMLKAEVEIYDLYLRGEVYGYKLYRIDEAKLEAYLKATGLSRENLSVRELELFLEEKDSCWGFYGDDFRENGLLDHVGGNWEGVI